MKGARVDATKVIITLMATVTPVDSVAAAVTVGAVEDWHRDNNYRALVYHNQSTVLLYQYYNYVTGSGKTAELILMYHGNL